MTKDLQYGHSQLNLHSDAAHHCNFNVVSADMTGTYPFKTVFNGLLDMPAEFQKAIDCTLAGLTNTFYVLCDILIVSRGRFEYQFNLVRKCLIKFDQENHQINLAKCHFAEDQIEWLGHCITQSEIKLTPLKNYFHLQISKNCDIFWDQYIIYANSYQTCFKCVTQLNLYLKKYKICLNR